MGPGGNIYVASTGAGSVVVFTPELNPAFSWPVPEPVSICYDPVAQLVYVGQQWSKLVHSYRTDGTFVATYNTESLPRSIATDQSGNIYIGEDNNHLYKYDANFVKQYEWSFSHTPQGLKVIGETVYLADGMDEIFKSRVVSADNNLSSLSVDGQAVSLASTNSSITVSSATSSVNIVPTAAAGSPATIRVNGTVVGSGDSCTVAVAAGENPISIEVTAESGDKKTYTVTVTRSVPPDIVVKRLLGGYYWYDGGCYDDCLYFGGDGEAAISFDLTGVSGTVLEATLNAKVLWGWSNLSPEHSVNYSIYGTSEDSWFGTDAFPSTRQEPPFDQGTLPATGADYWLSFAGAAGFVQQQLVPGDGLCSFILGSPDVSGYYAAVYDSTSSLPDQPYLSIRLAAIDLVTATFDRNVANQADVSFNVILSDSVSAIKLGSEVLEAGVDYAISGSTVTISKTFLASLPDGANVLTVEMNACSPQSLTITVTDTTPADALPPVVGGSGVLTTSNLTDRSLDLGWTAASDDTTEAASLQYRVVRATDSIDSLAEADAAEEVAPWTTNLTSQHVDGLYGGTAYNFAVIVRDGVGNRALYTSLPVSTPRTSITVTALAQSKVYGASDPAELEYQVTGSLYGGDAFSGALVRAAGEAADSYSISIGSLAIAPHPERYALAFSGSNFTITPRVLTVTADSVQKTYGEENPDLSVSYGGFVSGEDSSVLGGSLALTTAATTSSGAGVYSITPSGLTSSNYAISFVDGELQVNPAPLTITADNKSRVYGDTDPAFTYQVTAGALINGDTLSGTAVRTAGNDVGSYAIEQGTLTAGSNYLISYVPGVLVISQRPITVSAETVSKAYGESDPVFTYQLSSGELVDGDAFAGDLTRVAGNGVGDYQIQLGSLSAGSNYALTYVPADLKITRRPISASGVGAEDKVYDRSSAASLTLGGAGLDGLVTGDDVILQTDAAVGTFVDGTAGSNKTVTVTGLALTGTDVGNYELQPYTTTATITQKPIEAAGVAAQGKVYDGTTNAVLDKAAAGLSGVIDGDTVSLVTDTAAGSFVSKNVGADKAVTVTGLSLSGLDAGNYALQPYTTTAAITVKTVEATGVSALDRVYDRTANVVLDKTAAGLGGVVDGDDLILVTDAAVGALADKNAGVGKTVTVAGLALSGADAENYALQPYTTTTTITSKAVDATGITAGSRAYDGSTNAALDKSLAGLSGVVDGDALTLVTDAATGSFADKSVGADKTVAVAGLTLSGVDAGNYVLQPYTTTATITAKAVDATGIQALDRVYDGTMNVALDKTAAALSGAVDGDDLVLVTDAADGTFADKKVGVGKTVTVADLGLSGVDAGNYVLQPYTTTATITAKAVEATGITAVDRVYDGSVNAALDKTAAGLSEVVDGDGLTIVTDAATGTFLDKNVGVGKAVTVAGLTLSGVDAGNYALQPYTTAATIMRKAVDVTGITALDRVYDGSNNAALDKNAAGLSGVVDGDGLVLVTDAAVGISADKQVGVDKTVAVAGLTLSGVDAGNYVLQPYTTTATITAKAVDATGIQALDRVYDGTSNAALDKSLAGLSGVIAGDGLALVTDGAAGTFLDENAGVGKTVTVAGLALSGADVGNYALQPCTTTATITQKAADATGITALDRVYDGSINAALDKTAAGLSGVVDGDDLVLVTDAATGTFLDKNVGSGKTVTVADLTLSGVDAGNYDLQPYTTTAAITRKAVDATGITALDRVYDSSVNAALDKTAAGLSGVVDGDGLALVTDAATGTFFDKKVGVGKTVTVAGLTLSGVDAGNYALQPYTITATITQKAVDAKDIAALDRVYDGTTNAALERGAASLSGVVDGDDLVLVTDVAIGTFADKTVGVGKTVTVAGLALSGVDAGNYALQPYTTTATITAKAVDATGIQALDRVYDGTMNVALDKTAAALSGAVNGDDLTLITDAATGTFADKNVGVGKTVTVADLTLNGADVGNYALQPYTTAATITPKQLSVSGIVALSKYADGTAAVSLLTSEASLVGVVLGDDVHLDTSQASGSFADALIGVNKPVAVNGLALAGTDAGNYQLNPCTTTASITDEPEPPKPPAPPIPPAGNVGIAIIVNGETQDESATATTTTEDDRTVTTVVIDPDKLEERLEQEGDNATVTLPVNTGADLVIGELTGQTVKNMETKSAVLEIKTERVTYTLPASQISIDSVAEQLGDGVGLQDVKVSVHVAEPPADTVRIVEDTADRNNYQVVVKPIEFTIKCTHEDKSVEVSRFSGYVERMVAIPDGIDPARITTGVVLNDDGTFSHVPTTIVMIDGKYYAKINSLTNSVYSVIWNPTEFQDMTGHWAKGPVNDMASRLVMAGETSEAFGPNKAITRGEFAATIVKALGLRPETGESPFVDLHASHRQYGHILTAYQYHIMGGLPGSKFGADRELTREEAMAIVVSAMRLTKLSSVLSAAEVNTTLAAYADSARVSGWACNVVAACLKSGIIGGRPGNVIAPKDIITRAEAAAIMQRFLRQSGLI